MQVHSFDKDVTTVIIQINPFRKGSKGKAIDTSAIAMHSLGELISVQIMASSIKYYLRCTDVDRRTYVRVGMSSHQSRLDPLQSVERDSEIITTASIHSGQYFGLVVVNSIVVYVQTGRDCTGEP